MFRISYIINFQLLTDCHSLLVDIVKYLMWNTSCKSLS